MLDFLKPEKVKPLSFRPMLWWQRLLHRVVYDGVPFRRCYWCGRWYVSCRRYVEHCSRQCNDEEFDWLD